MAHGLSLALHAPVARNLASCVSPHGEGMWTTGLSSDGQAPATHYISTGQIDAAFVAILTDAGLAFDTATLGALAQGKTLVATLPDTVALVAAADVSTEDPFDAMARLGLTLTT